MTKESRINVHAFKDNATTIVSIYTQQQSLLTPLLKAALLQ